MRIALIVLVLGLSACGAPQHPLTYVQPNDPMWQVNPPEPQATSDTRPMASNRPPPLDYRIKSSLVVTAR